MEAREGSVLMFVVSEAVGLGCKQYLKPQYLSTFTTPKGVLTLPGNQQCHIFGKHHKDHFHHPHGFYHECTLLVCEHLILKYGKALFCRCSLSFTLLGYESHNIVL